MAEPSIVFEQVWKKFKRGEVHDSLRDLIPALTRRMLSRRPRSADALEQREFWALRDISFEVKPGEALGIIGANGAGKSTTLKILNRILRPTRGHVEVRGRAGALIEVSAGFHPDLTGRENVYLQGAIMGMRKAEIVRKFDQIVDFAGIPEFIDTPVKRYSSGMNARLGFSIAAHLDPDVLIIDEVLAVGDFSFQERAFGRIREMVQSGIPVAIVSHQLDRIASLCTKAILLSHGRIARAGTAQECIAEYVAGADLGNVEHAADAAVRIDSVALLDEHLVTPGEVVTLRVTGNILRPLDESCDPLLVRVRVVAWGGGIIYEVGSRVLGVELPEVGPFVADVELQCNLGPGVYRVDALSVDTRTTYEVSNLGTTFFSVSDGSPPFGGVAQLNGRMRLVPPAPTRRLGAAFVGSPE